MVRVTPSEVGIYKRKQENMLSTKKAIKKKRKTITVKKKKENTLSTKKATENFLFFLGRLVSWSRACFLSFFSYFLVSFYKFSPLYVPASPCLLVMFIHIKSNVRGGSGGEYEWCANKWGRDVTRQSAAKLSLKSCKQSPFVKLSTHFTTQLLYTQIKCVF